MRCQEGLLAHGGFGQDISECVGKWCGGNRRRRAGGVLQHPARDVSRCLETRIETEGRGSAAGDHSIRCIGLVEPGDALLTLLDLCRHRMAQTLPELRESMMDAGHL